MDVRRLHIARRIRGFTLLELIITLAVASVVLTYVIPTFAQMVASARITTSLNELMTDIHLARSEAIKRGKRVAVCPSANGSSCLGSRGWPQGWIVFVDDNRDRTRNRDETLLQIHGALPPELIINPGRRARIIYQADGTLAGVLNGTYEFCDVNASAPPKAIIISRTGRPRVSPTRYDGTPLHCS